ncbi:MAG: protein-L-isoaspartate(D-aspartate) O-methyltransferase [Planctomycetia bacterium]|nr:protein-L-isoaspartate(D-aspartate) O-methyltransferase [Planctomycetia bacterium]
MKWVLFFLCFGISVSGWAQSEREMADAREQMVRRELERGGIRNPDVLAAMRSTPRHKFVPARLREQAYLEKSLPIGHGQTISSPFTVASMTEALDPQPTDRVLEIGTGSGYQAAVLSPLVESVYSIEIVEPLARQAAKTLKTLRYTNVHVRAGDGYQGWEEAAPFDKIIVTCSPESPPPRLVEQLKDGGIMVIPLGERYAQNLCVLKKKGKKLESRPIQTTLFVPMTGKAEEERQILPDPTKPELLNGSFENVMRGRKNPGLAIRSEEDSLAEEPVSEEVEWILIPEVWCYLRLAQIVEEKDLPDGRYCLKFSNKTLGKIAQACQGIGIDGRKVQQLHFQMAIRGESIYPYFAEKGYPGIYVIFIDENRKPVRSAVVGGWRGTFGWKTVSLTIPVPVSAREALVYVGLHGARGTLWVDQIQMVGE